MEQSWDVTVEILRDCLSGDALDSLTNAIDFVLATVGQEGGAAPIIRGDRPGKPLSADRLALAEPHLERVVRCMRGTHLPALYWLSTTTLGLRGFDALPWSRIPGTAAIEAAQLRFPDTARRAHRAAMVQQCHRMGLDPATPFPFRIQPQGSGPSVGKSLRMSGATSLVDVASATFDHVSQAAGSSPSEGLRIAAGLESLGLHLLDGPVSEVWTPHGRVSISLLRPREADLQLLHQHGYLFGHAGTRALRQIDSPDGRSVRALAHAFQRLRSAASEHQAAHGAHQHISTAMRRNPALAAAQPNPPTAGRRRASGRSARSL